METSREVNKVSEQKIEQFWRDVKHGDVARVMNGERIEARFRAKTGLSWKHGLLSGWSKIDKSDDLQWVESNGALWQFCQVYDPPAILKNKPEPGEGYRLLEKFPPEDKQAGDEWYDCKNKAWVYASGSKIQRVDAWYRRRIANNPTSSESCQSRDTIPSGWRVLGKDEERLASDAYWSLGCKEWVVLGDDRVCDANSQQWHAIRRLGSFDLVVGFQYILPSGKVVRIIEKGFEVL
jgi:hypothetical protein